MTYRAVLGLAVLASVGGSAMATEPRPPLQSFAEQTPPPAPDYARPESWAARPGREGAASAVPPGATPRATTPGVDVFYINPTTYRSKTRWNQDVADVEANG